MTDIKREGRQTVPYRPSNGTEGGIFMEVFCFKCQKDAAFQRDPEHNDGCPILAASFCFGVNEPGYPKEWVRDEDSDITLIGGNGARCTAFVPVGQEEVYRCPHTQDMFSASRSDLSPTPKGER